MKKEFLLVGAAAMALTAYAPGVAQAQEDDAELKQDVIIVSARKREETLLEAPVAVSVFDSTAIENLQLQSVDDVARFTPGLSFSSAFGRSTERPVIRGQSNVLAGVQFGVESGTAYFIDGVYFAGSIQSLDPNELQRVEVIKGPQSALYGRNTYAGAINFITRGGSDEFEGSAKARFGSHDTRELAASIAGPLLPGLTGRLSVRDYEYGGEFTNEVTRELVGQEKSTSISTVLDWRPTEMFDSRLRVSFQEDRDGTIPLFLQPAASNNCLPGYRSLSSWIRSGSTNTNQYYCGVIRPAPVALNTGPDADGVPNIVPGVPLTALLPSPPHPTAWPTVQRSTGLTATSGRHLLSTICVLAKVAGASRCSAAIPRNTTSSVPTVTTLRSTGSCPDRQSNPSSPIPHAVIPKTTVSSCSSVRPRRIASAEHLASITIIRSLMREISPSRIRLGGRPIPTSGRSATRQFSA